MDGYTRVTHGDTIDTKNVSFLSTFPHFLTVVNVLRASVVYNVRKKTLIAQAVPVQTEQCVVTNQALETTHVSASQVTLVNLVMSQ